MTNPAEMSSADTRKRFDPARVAVGIGLGAWAGLFWYLLITGKWSLYLAARVDWLVPVAGVCFSIGALGCLLTARVPGPQPLSVKQGRTFAAIIAPVLLVLLVPLGTLTDFAAERRTSFSLAGFSDTNPITSGEPLTFQQLVGAKFEERGMNQLAERQGETVELDGLVMSPQPDGFTLTRFVVACCVVDATVAEVAVRGVSTEHAEGSWVSVRGPLSVADGEVSIERPEIERTEAPDPPYLYP